MRLSPFLARGVKQCCLLHILVPGMSQNDYLFFWFGVRTQTALAHNTDVPSLGLAHTFGGISHNKMDFTCRIASADLKLQANLDF